MILPRRVLLVCVLSCCTGVASSEAVEGLLLYTRAPGGSSYTGAGELHLAPLGGTGVLGQPFTVDTEVLSAQFSPAGDRVAYVRLRNGYEQIVVCDLDGANRQVLKDSIVHPGDIRWCTYLCWRLPKNILYSYDLDTNIMSIHPVTGAESVYYAAGVGFSKVSVSADGRRMTLRARTGFNGVYNIDLDCAREWSVASGCSNWISPDGTMLTHCTGGWHDYAIRRFHPDSILKTYSAPDQTHLAHWSHNSNDWIIYQRSESNNLVEWSHLYIRDITTDQEIQLTGHRRYNDTGRDFWVGDMGELGQVDTTPPSVPVGLHQVDSGATTARVRWDPATDAESGVTTYRVYRGDTAVALVHDTFALLENLPQDTVCEVSVSDVNAWGFESEPSAPLIVMTLDMALTREALYVAPAHGTLSDSMVAVSEPASIAAAVVHGTYGGASSPQSGDSRSVLQVDIPADGTWYAWGRFKFEEGTANSYWLQIDDQPAVRFGNGEDQFGAWHWEGYMADGAVDLGWLAAGTHTLTVWSREPDPRCLLDIVCLTNDPLFTPTDSDIPAGAGVRRIIRVDYPNGGQQFSVGDTLTIRWTAFSLDLNLVDISYSPDLGETWVILNPRESISRDSSAWDNFVWVIPDTLTGGIPATGASALVRVASYEVVTADYADISDAVFTVTDYSHTLSPVPRSRALGAARTRRYDLRGRRLPSRGAKPHANGILLLHDGTTVRARMLVGDPRTGVAR